jgi:hypothetical protein
MPEGFHLNPIAPNRYEISASEGSVVEFASSPQKFQKLPLEIPFTALKTGATEVRLKTNIYYCREDNTGVCLIKTLTFRIPLVIAADGKPDSIEITGDVR